jgi:hypothetical protein
MFGTRDTTADLFNYMRYRPGNRHSIDRRTNTKQSDHVTVGKAYSV